MDSLPRRQHRVHFSVYTAFACVLAGTVLLALVAAMATKKFVYGKSQGAEIRRGAPNPFPQEYEPKFFFREDNRTDCTSHTCEWNTAYLFRAEVPAAEPCSDFYLHACGGSWYSRVDHKRRPYKEYSIVQLMLDVEYFFKRFLALKGNYRLRPNHNFLVQAMWVNDRCQAEQNRTTVVPTVEKIMKALGLSGWPFREFAGRLTFQVGTGDRLLRLRPLFDVTYGKRAETGPRLFLRAPQTLYRRYMIGGVAASDETYVALVASSLERYVDTDAAAVARGILKLEKTLEDCKLAEAEEFVMPASSRVVPVDEIYLGPRWNWMEYFEVLFGGEYAASNRTTVVVEDPVFFGNLGHVFDSLSSVDIINYVGYKALVELSPFLGENSEFLMDLSHEYDVAGITGRKVACLALLEKLYRYGMGIAAKLTLGKEFATTYRTHLDSQMAFFFTLMRNILTQLVQSHRSWIDPVDTAAAVRKVDTVRLAFGTQANLVEYETYRQTASVPIDERNVLEAVFKIYVHASALYWDPRHPSDRAYDNLFESGVFAPGYEYHDADSTLFLPHGVVGFLNHISNQIHPILYPAILVHLLRGLLTVLSKTTSFDGREHKSWWSVGTTEVHDRILRCLQAQYAAPADEKELPSALELNFVDNVSLYPLYLVYKSSVRKLNIRNLYAEMRREKTVSAEQLFFYNYAAAHCEKADNSTWQRQAAFRVTPARWRVNVPLRNFPPFAESFGCPSTSYMNPPTKCLAWK